MRGAALFNGSLCFRAGVIGGITTLCECFKMGREGVWKFPWGFWVRVGCFSCSSWWYSELTMWVSWGCSSKSCYDSRDAKLSDVLATIYDCFLLYILFAFGCYKSSESRELDPAKSSSLNCLFTSKPVLCFFTNLGDAPLVTYVGISSDLEAEEFSAALPFGDSHKLVTRFFFGECKFPVSLLGEPVLLSSVGLSVAGSYKLRSSLVGCELGISAEVFIYSVEELIII